MTDLTSQETHFAFGENWSQFSALIDDQRIAQSDEGLAKLLRASELEGKTAIDIGCGSGLPALSMLRAGAAHVTCVDIDPNSVETTRRTLGGHAPHANWTAKVESVFDLTGAYDVVYSWGVLHHTGDMWRAIDRAASLVKPGGLFTLAIYGKTKLCGAWTVEKRVYSQSPKWIQALMRLVHHGLFFAVKLAKGRDPFAYIRDYNGRGMNWSHDVHDWMGGYPYESATPQEIDTFLTERGFQPVRQNTFPSGRLGLSGSGCDEYVFRKT